jgi:hypothetical protein
MGIARDLAAHGAQAEPLSGIKGGGFHTAIVKDQRLGAAAFEEEFAIIRTLRGVPEVAQGRIAIKGGVEGAKGSVGHGVLLLWVRQNCLI